MIEVGSVQWCPVEMQHGRYAICPVIHHSVSRCGDRPREIRIVTILGGVILLADSFCLLPSLKCDSPRFVADSGNYRWSFVLVARVIQVARRSAVVFVVDHLCYSDVDFAYSVRETLSPYSFAQFLRKSREWMESASRHTLGGHAGRVRVLNGSSRFHDRLLARQSSHKENGGLGFVWTIQLF